jgi:ribosomal protein L37AE/L43A
MTEGRIATQEQADCPKCQEVTLTQRECATCQSATVEVDKNGEHFWVCTKCGDKWDGGANYNFACADHGGTAPAGRNPNKDDLSYRRDADYSRKQFNSGACAYMPKF